MDLEKVFKIIRKEQAVLWVGSGFSKYAGYPLGGELAKIIYNELTEFQRETIDEHLTLPALTEEFIRCNLENRNELNRLLLQHFYKEPTSLKYHSLLAKIPHFKTIITTNYDRLFELGYKNTAHVIFNDNHLAHLENKTEIFKVHGDLSDLSSIIIAQRDYDDYFFNRKEKPLLWTVVTERITTKSVVFVGYNLEDPNVNVIFKEILRSLGNNRKEAFLIAPKLSPHKQSYLIQKGIQYYDMPGEEFVQALYNNIKKNIRKDFDKKWISTETLNKFIDPLDLTAQISLNGSNQSLISLSLKPGKTAKANFKFSISKDQLEIQEKFSKFISGENLEDFILESKQVNDAEVLLSGISLFEFKDENDKLIFKHLPISKGEIKVVFIDQKEFPNLEYEVFKTKNKVVINLQLNKAILTIKGEATELHGLNLDIEYAIPERYTSVNEAIFNYEFLYRLHIGMGFTVFVGNKKHEAALNPSTGINLKETFNKSIKYFTSLKEIEKHYNHYFQNLSEGERDYKLVNHLKDLIKRKKTSIEWKNKLIYKAAKEEDLENVVNVINGENAIAFPENELEIVHLHDLEIKLGYRFTLIPDPYIFFDPDDKLSIQIGSKSNKIEVFYKDTPNLIEGK